MNTKIRMMVIQVITISVKFVVTTMKSKVAQRILSETSEETKQKARDMARDMIKKNEEKTTSEDIQTMLDYMDKLGIEYTIDRNPSPEKIKQIQESIARSEAYMKSVQDAFKK
jgi:ribosomal protein L17